MTRTAKLTQLTKYVATGVAVAMLTACGGSSSTSTGGGSEDTNSTIEHNDTIEIIPNNIPVITNSATVTVDENQNSVLTVTATDADGDTLAYSIEGGADGDKVAINSSTGAVVFLENPDFEIKSSYSFQVGASDSVDTATQNVTVTISDVFEGSAPIISTEDVSVDENQKTAFTISATDVDGDALAYSLEGGVDDSSFDINATTGVVTFKTEPDFETKDSYQVTVGVDDGHDTTTKDITVSILDIQGGSRVLQTGQTTRYRLNDDGAYQAGVERSFTKEGSVVTDAKTGLYWKDNGTIPRKKYTDAKNYCNSLNNNYGANGYSGYKNWRLPTVEELSMIIDRGSDDGAIFDSFRDTDTDRNYWSSTERIAGNHYTVDFKKGGVLFASDTQSLNVRCVRSNLLSLISIPLNPFVSIRSYDRFTRVGGVISDDKTKLQWHDPVRIEFSLRPLTRTVVGLPATTGTFDEAIAGCEDLVADGKNDWRLANVNEMISIADYSLEDENIFHDEFKSVAKGYYITSTTSNTDSDKAWGVFFNGDGFGALGVGLVGDDLTKTSTANYRCVRTMGD